MRSNKKPIYKLLDIKAQVKYEQLPNKKWALLFVKVVNTRQGIFRERSFIYDLTCNLIINQNSTQQILKIEENYSPTKDFSKELEKLDNIRTWDNNYKLSLSKDERRILEDIYQKEISKEN